MTADTPLPLEIDCQAAAKLLREDSQAVLVDCRETQEHQLVNIPQARLLPMSELEQRCSELDACRDARIVVHCHHGGRSLRVTQWLRERGFTRVQSLAGGIDEWAVQIAPGMKRY